jgi:hypothetical protein
MRTTELISNRSRELCDAINADIERFNADFAGVVTLPKIACSEFA